MKMNPSSNSLGNWRDRSSWSDIARATFLDSKLLSEPVSSINPAITDPVRKIYGIEYQHLAVRLANNLFRDIYEVALHPKQIASCITKHAAAAEYGQDIARALKDYGSYGVAYADGNFSGVLPEGSWILRGGFAFLIPKSGMPLKDFLLWYKGTTASTSLRAIIEWSGIPHENLSPVYDALLVFIRNEIKHEYRPKGNQS